MKIGEGTLLQPNFSISIRSGLKTGRVWVGRASVLDCHITLERGIGTISIGDNTFIGASSVVCAQEIEIGSDVLIAWGCTIVDHDSHSLQWEERANDVKSWREGLQTSIQEASTQKNWGGVQMAPVRIKDKAWIGFNSIILKGITVGEGSVVAAGSVVTKDVPPWTVVGGNPARIIREIPHDN